MDKQFLEALEAKFTEFKAGLPQGITESVLETKLEALKNELQTQIPEVKDFSAEIEELKNSILEMEKKDGVEDIFSVKDAVMDFFTENEIKSVSDLTKFVGREIELKDINENPFTNASVTGNVGRTQVVSGLRFPNERPLAFIDKIRKGTVDNDKNIILWNPGAFTETVGYIGELTSAKGTLDGNKATVVEKTRKMAKIAARMILSAETFEDLGQFAQRLESKLLEKITLWLDAQILNGEGNDSTKPNEIYGVLTGQNTAFDTTNAMKVFAPNEADLADAMVTQAEENGFTATHVWMTPKRAYKLRRTKDTTGNYVVQQLATGELVMGGLKVIKSTLMQGSGTDAMLVGAPDLITLWLKRNLSLEVVRDADIDGYRLYVYQRSQVLVEDEDIKGLIYVADVDSALDSIEQVS